MNIILRIAVAVLAFALLVWLLPWLASLANLPIPDGLTILVAIVVAIVVYVKGDSLR